MRRIVGEFAGLAGALDPLSFAHYLANTAIALPAVLKTRKLEPIDRRMRGRARFRTWRDPVVMDCARIDREIAEFDNSCTFTLARELFGRNSYLRAFRRFSASGQTVLDLGANRGMFSAMAAAALTPARIVAVEPQDSYLPVFKGLTRESRCELVPLTGFIGANQFKDSEGLADLDSPVLDITRVVADYGPIAFLKVDIEGAEEALFSGNADWLKSVDRIAMELHPYACDTASVLDAVRRAGFSAWSSDHNGAPAPISEAEFLYAARDPSHLASQPAA